MKEECWQMNAKEMVPKPAKNVGRENAKACRKRVEDSISNGVHVKKSWQTHIFVV
jgi:hypothetical protein